MNWDDLEAFRAVADHLSYSRAAQQLDVTVSTLSQRVTRLERTVDAKLLLRTTRTVRLTPAGQLMLDFADRTASGWRTVLHEIRTVDRPTSRSTPHEVRVGICAPDSYDLVHRLRTAQPTTRWRAALHASLDRAAADLIDGVVSALVWYRWPFVEEPMTRSLVTIGVAREELWVSLPARHPLTTADRVDLTHLADEEWVTSSQPAMQVMLQRACRHAGGFTPRIGHETDDRAQIAGLIAGEGAVHLDSPACPPVDGVVRRPVRTPPMGELKLTWDRDRLPSSVAQLIRRELSAGYADTVARHNPGYWSRAMTDTGHAAPASAVPDVNRPSGRAG